VVVRAVILERHAYDASSLPLFLSTFASRWRKAVTKLLALPEPAVGATSLRSRSDYLMPSRDEDTPGVVGEIPTIYELPSHWRNGIGRSLWERALPALKDE
jgi:hypothetical protein